MKVPNIVKEYPNDNAIEISDEFSMTHCTVELCGDSSASITILPYGGTKPYSTIFYPEDWAKFKNFINTHECQP